MLAREVHVTGYGLVAPMALNAQALFTRLCEEQSCIRAHPLFVELGFANTAAGYLDSQQWQAIYAALEQPCGGQPRQAALAQYVAEQALQHAQFDRQSLAKPRSGLFIGANKYCASAQELDVVSQYFDAHGRVDLDAYLDHPSSQREPFAWRVDQQTQHLADYLGVGQHIATHADACAAGTMAIGSAYRAIADGHLDIALCGATELMANELPYYMFSSLGALCAKGDWPADTQSRPFMRDRCGFVLSEGAAMLVLESREHAERRQAVSLGRVLGYANLCEAEKMTSSSRDGSKYALCMQAALADAGLTPGEIDQVNLHGTSTAVNDSCEALALEQVFADHLAQLQLTANKSAVGHSLAGSGAIEAVLSLQSIAHGVQLPTLNYHADGAQYPHLNLHAQVQTQTVNTVLSNSFGFGGINSAIVLGRA
ncbi:3-oxoacyl-(acyl-carrier-protein) synthase [Atopomonas hussainii]|uniref:3-oxoacyl-(Acyl-carrier-protein) synthase n=1 Tax=Atopomonas hussainii TaxID=1429083 RepID=A0A1H7FE95_9GAMM|nr:beta-ketoacyl-[acyl-carrier-protein] synthase family protein [Atopomonas hussainii]SEK24503.1 3-oxoacyl-(acyl-carrier-protein) synthase [Atopomonas hussainii]